MFDSFGRGVGEIIGTYAVSQVKSYMTPKEVNTIEEKEVLLEELEEAYERKKNFRPGMWGRIVSSLAGGAVGFPVGYSIRTKKVVKQVTNV